MSILCWILEFFICFIETGICFDFCDLFFSHFYGIYKKLIISFPIVSIIFLMNTKQLVSPLASIIIIGLYWIVQLSLRKCKPIKLLFVIFLYFSLIFVIDYIFSIVISICFKINVKEVFISMSSVRTVAGVSSKMTLILVVWLLKKITDIKEKSNVKINIISTVATIIIIIISTIMYITQTEIVRYDSEFFMLLVFVILLFMIFTIFYTLTYVMKKETQKQEYILIEQQNILLKKSLKEQENTFLSWKKSIHDYKHKLTALDGMMKSGKYDDVIKNIEDELEYYKDKAFYISTGNNTIDILLNNKMQLAKIYNINFTFNILIEKEIPLTDIQLSVILGNLIDNAMEAVESEKTKEVYVQINHYENKLVIKVVNTFTKEKIILETAKNKRDMHGIGLKSVKQIVDEHNGDFSLKLKNGYVTALIVV